MFGHSWESAQAIIVSTHVKSTTGDGMVSISEYAADVHPASGVVFRATIQEPTIATNFWPPRIGDQVSVLIDAKNQKVKFDKDDPRLDAKARKVAAASKFEATAHAAPFNPPAFSAQASANASADPAQRLAKLDALKASGLISDEEFAAARQQIINNI